VNEVNLAIIQYLKHSKYQTGEILSDMSEAALGGLAEASLLVYLSVNTRVEIHKNEVKKFLKAVSKAFEDDFSSRAAGVR